MTPGMSLLINSLNSSPQCVLHSTLFLLRTHALSLNLSLSLSSNVLSISDESEAVTRTLNIFQGCFGSLSLWVFQLDVGLLWASVQKILKNFLEVGLPAKRSMR